MLTSKKKKKKNSVVVNLIICENSFFITGIQNISPI